MQISPSTPQAPVKASVQPAARPAATESKPTQPAKAASDDLKLSQSQAKGSAGVTFDVLSLNTFGLPKPLGEAIAERHSRIGKSLGSYEIAGLQETFSGESKHLAKGTALTGLTYHMHKPTESRLLNSGLTTFSRYEIVESGFKPFKFGSHADALAEKGVSFTRLKIPGGGMVDVYNTHFQAAKDKADGPLDRLWLKGMAQIFPGYDMPRDQIREHDAQVLIDYVKAQDKGYPVIIMGDFNTQDHQPVYDKLKQELGLQDSFRELNPTDPGYTSDGKTNPYKDDPAKRKRVDYVFYRPGENMELKALSSELAYDEAVDGMFVSDHYGVQTRFQLSPKAAEK